ncbi:bifunctional levopimaradiene synthase, chloroplastic-like [Amborella trichopoda]|uniref:bifunctional levopimaradiene synthase, chloroplastic-like n=1 Tax=Amborella trichopoda TaxID=13333 RepID=UPI0009BDD798|nr:bifunctional levopimaradiene synthase, chloroplastic-like [Amborella trichopoda]|eukprot:XP_020528240.1 bifunctional levopimaradiene synthase, chloroplastic-like [Amborella trichopoda]
MDNLVKEIKEEIASYIEGEKGRCIHQKLKAVDMIQRLGIERFFKEQVKEIMHSLYRQWDQELGLGSVELTGLGFRLLRLHGYQMLLRSYWKKVERLVPFQLKTMKALQHS